MWYSCLNMQIFSFSNVSYQRVNLYDQYCLILWFTCSFYPIWWEMMFRICLKDLIFVYFWVGLMNTQVLLDWYSNMWSEKYVFWCWPTRDSMLDGCLLLLLFIWVWIIVFNMWSMLHHLLVFFFLKEMSLKVSSCIKLNSSK